MKKLGLVGGIGPESTIPYYKKIVYGVQQKLGIKKYPELVIESINVFEVLRLCTEQKYNQLTDYILQAMDNLAAAGADFAAISANTPHIVFDELKKYSTLPLVSIVQATCDEANKLGYTKIGLLGTIFTMTGEFFKKPFVDSGIEIVTPTSVEMEHVNSKIADELEVGIVKEDTRQAFLNIINRMKEEEDVQAIVLGCTELPLILNDEVSPLPCLDTMEIHIRRLVEMIVAE